MRQHQVLQCVDCGMAWRVGLDAVTVIQDADEPNMIGDPLPSNHVARLIKLIGTRSMR